MITNWDLHQWSFAWQPEVLGSILEWCIPKNLDMGIM